MSEISSQSMDELLKSLAIATMLKGDNCLISRNGIDDTVLEILGFTFVKSNIVNFCNDRDTMIEAMRLCDKFNNNVSTSTLREIYEFMIQNEDKIDKEKYVLSSVGLMEFLMAELDGRNESLKQDFLESGNPDSIMSAMKANNRDISRLREFCRGFCKIGTGMDGILPSYAAFTEYGLICFFDAKVAIDHKNLDYEKASRRFDRLDRAIIHTLDKKYDGIKYILDKFSYSEFCSMFKNKEIPEFALFCLEKNHLNLDIVELSIPEIIDSLKPNEDFDLSLVLDALKGVTREHAFYLDFDKFILLAIHRCEEELERSLSYKEVSPTYYRNQKKFINVLLDNLNNKKLVIDEELSNKGDMEHKRFHVHYTYNDAKKVLKRFVGDTYISKNMVSDVREELLDGSLDIGSVDQEMLKMADLSNEEIESIMYYHLNNYMYGIKRLKYNPINAVENFRENDNFSQSDVVYALFKSKQLSVEDIIGLYMRDKLNIFFFKKYASELQISDYINISNINDMYFDLKHEGNLSDPKLEAYINIFIVLNIFDNDNIDSVYEQMMCTVAESFEDDSDIIFYYKNSLISLEVLADWGGDEPVWQLYSNSDIKLSDVISIRKRISKELLEKIIIDSNLDDDEMLGYAFDGYLSEKAIIEMFYNRELFRKDAKRLQKAGRISQPAYNLIKNRNINVISDRVGERIDRLVPIEMPVFTDGDLSLPLVDSKRELKQTSSKSSYGEGDKGLITIINPFSRIEYLELLKFFEPYHMNYDSMGSKNPFYNYNFYVMQEECLGPDLRGDAIIVAERIFDNREKRRGLARENATYVMRYEDYLILMGKHKKKDKDKKGEIIKEIPGAIYTVNHRSGSWGMNLLKAIAKAKAGSDFSSLPSSKKMEAVVDWLHTMYNSEELTDIRYYAEELDDEESHTFYLDEDGVYRKLYPDDDTDYNNDFQKILK